jgi:hypothetical protein
VISVRKENETNPEGGNTVLETGVVDFRSSPGWTWLQQMMYAGEDSPAGRIGAADGKQILTAPPASLQTPGVIYGSSRPHPRWSHRLGKGLIYKLKPGLPPHIANSLPLRRHWSNIYPPRFVGVTRMILVTDVVWRRWPARP